MQNHIKNYLERHRIGEQDIILCEECGGIAVDIHHIIKKSQGGDDKADNLRALCRSCHEKYH